MDSERVTRALELALAGHGIAWEPVDDIAPVGETLARLLAEPGEPCPMCDNEDSVPMFGCPDCGEEWLRAEDFDAWAKVRAASASEGAEEEPGATNAAHRYALALDYALDHYVPSTSAKAECLSFVNGYHGDGDITHWMPTPPEPESEET